MIHNFYFFGRKPSVTLREFHRHYLEVHPYADPPIKAVKLYIQNHRCRSLGGNSPFDAVSECWTEVLARDQSVNEEGSKIRVADEEHFIDAFHTGWMAAADRVILQGEQKSNMIQGVFQLTHKFGVTLEGFRDYWLNVHAPIVRTLPGLRHYQQCPVVDDAYRYGDQRWDGVEEIWFDDYEAARRTLDSSEYKHGVLPDFANFAEPSWHFFSEVQLVTWPGKRRSLVTSEIAAKVEQGWRD
jgi:uncharacterized protein (TIGR02118 family)